MTNPLVCLQYLQSQIYGYGSLQSKKGQNGQKLIEKSRISHVCSFDIVIRSAYFEAQKLRKYMKSVGVNRSVHPKTPTHELHCAVSKELICF